MMTIPRLADITTILFDAGNTLAFVDLARVERIFAEAGAPQSRPRLEAAERVGRAAMYRVSESQPDILDQERWETYMQAMFDEINPGDASVVRHIHDTLLSVHRAENLWRHVPDGTAALLEDLIRRDFRLGVVSNADGRVPTLLRELHLAHFFETIVDSHLVGVEKPDPRIFELALEELGESPRQAVYVGDLPAVDVVGAQRAGLQPVLLDPLAITHQVECPVIASLIELGTLLPERAGT